MENYKRKFLIKMPESLGDGIGYSIKLYADEKAAAILLSDGDTFGFDVIADITNNDFYSEKAIEARGGRLLTLEVERRWLVKIPPNISDFKFSRIEQAYLAPESGFQGRIRRLDDRYIYTEKARTGKNLVRIENEREITAEEYEELKRHTILNTVKKRRYIIPYGELEFEFDVFENTVEEGYAVMEAELPDENASAVPAVLPDFIEVIREVTEDVYYTNRNFASMDKIRLLKE